MPSLGQKIKAARKAAKITQIQLADMTHLSRGYIGAVKIGTYNPSLATLQSIAEALNVPVGNFLEEEKVATDGFNDDEIRLIENYRELSADNQKTLWSVIAAFLTQQAATKLGGIIQNNFGNISNSANSSIQQKVF